MIEIGKEQGNEKFRERGGREGDNINENKENENKWVFKGRMAESFPELSWKTQILWQRGEMRCEWDLKIKCKSESP